MKKVLSLFLCSLLFLSAAPPIFAQRAQSGATLYVGPGTSTFTVGSTFTLSFYVDTGDEFINAVEAKILFPPDKIQVVSPSTGASFINVWAIQPSFSNEQGTISFRGAVPSPGINTSAGLISTVTFRVKSVGDAVIRFSDDSRVLLNDGLGTDILQQKQSGVYRLTLPPPAGPIVASQTHPDQSRWYPLNDAILSWALDSPATGYSYVLSSSPVEVPDDIPDGTATSAAYKSLANGQHYFHIKALRGGVWGGTTHFAVNVDSEAPAQFPIEFVPSARTSRHEPVVRFLSTDVHSGIDYYEIKLVGLNIDNSKSDQYTEQQFFVEARSPYIPSYLPLGAYDVIVRAYDHAGNVQETIARLDIVKPLFSVVQDIGISFYGLFVIPWWLFWILAVILLLFAGVIAFRVEQWHRRMHHANVNRKLPDEVHDKLQELKEYQRKYGKMAVILLVFITGGLAAFSPAAAQQLELSPPVISELSRNIFNDEIFYVGGRTSEPKRQVVLYLQSLDGGETLSFQTISDEDARWFYRHTTFLQSGGYVIWAQSRVDDALSPPSPQVTMTVASHAIQLGATRISYTTVYLFVILILLSILLGLGGMILFHYKHGKRKHMAFMLEAKRAEESIKRGFAVLRRDLEEEFKLLKQAKMTRALSKDEHVKQEQIMRDLEAVKRNIGEEIWELEKRGA